MASNFKPKSAMPALGLTLGAAGPQTGSIKKALDRLLTALVRELNARGRDQDLGTMARVQTVLRFERASLMALAAARKTDPESVRHRAELMAKAAHLSMTRDRLISDLGLDRPEPSPDPLAMLAAGIRKRHSTLDATVATPKTPETRSSASGPRSASDGMVTHNLAAGSESLSECSAPESEPPEHSAQESQT